MSVNTRSKAIDNSNVEYHEDDVLDLIKTQNKRLFEIQKQKMKAELKILNARLTKKKLKLMCLQKKFDARIATIKTLSDDEYKDKKKDEKNESDEILSKMKTLFLRFARLSQDEIIKIFINKFKSINLYRLRHMRDRQYEKYLNDERIDFEEDILRVKKTIETYKDYEKSIHDV